MKNDFKYIRHISIYALLLLTGLCISGRIQAQDAGLRIENSSGSVYLNIGSNAKLNISSPGNTGGIRLESGGSIDNSGSIQLAAGAWINNGNGLVNGSSGTVQMDNSSTQPVQGSVPTVFYDLVVNNAAGVSIDKDVVVTHALVLTNGNLSIGAHTLTVNGAVTGPGTISGSPVSNLVIGGAAGTLNFTAGSNLLKNLVLNNGASATLGTALNIVAGTVANTEGAVTVASGATLTTGGNLTLKSDANGTARIATSAGTINGAVTVERYLTTGFGGNRAWRFLSVPVKGQNFHAGWQENQPAGVNGNPGYGTNITSNVANATTAPTPGFDFATPGSSLLTWDVTTGTWQGGTVNALVNSTSNTSETTAGWLLYIRGDRSVTPSTSIGGSTTTTLRTKGNIYQGSQPSISIPAGKTVPVGNIFASAIDFTTSGLRTGNVDDVFYVWDPKLAGTYGLGAFQTFSSANSWQPVPGGGSYGTAANTIIQSGQAFFVRGTTGGAGGNITLTEACKTSGSAVVQTQATVMVRLKTSLYANSGNTELADGNVVVFNSAYSNQVDDADAIKLNNFGEKLAVKREGKLLALETRQPVSVTDTIYMDMQNLKQQAYRFVFEAENIDHPGLLGKLIDNFTGTSSLVILNGQSSYDFTVNNNPASAAADRFKVVFYSTGTLPVTFTSVKATAQGSAVAVQCKVSNQLNIERYEVERSADGINYTKMNTQSAVGANGGDATYNWLDKDPFMGSLQQPAANFYRVRSIGLGNDTKLSQVVTVKMASGSQSLTIYPNPVTHNTINLQLTGMPAGNYQLRLLNSAGQLLFTQVLVHRGINGTQAIKPGNTLARGNYFLEISGPDGWKMTRVLSVGE